MKDLNNQLAKRLKDSKPSSKMAEMAEQSVQGKINSFTGLFHMIELNEKEKEILETLLREHTTGKENISHDLRSLISITSEIKAINNQAVMLHGERIKQAQNILKPYRDGAFTAFLIAAYGNRQTPYNFLQYYEFYSSSPKTLRPQIEAMPRQAVYVLASREGSFEKKQLLVKNYNGETKNKVLEMIRGAFPLSHQDRRQSNQGDSLIDSLKKLTQAFSMVSKPISKKQQRSMQQLVKQLSDLIDNLPLSH